MSASVEVTPLHGPSGRLFVFLLFAAGIFLSDLGSFAMYEQAMQTVARPFQSSTPPHFGQAWGVGFPVTKNI